MHSPAVDAKKKRAVRPILKLTNGWFHGLVFSFQIFRVYKPHFGGTDPALTGMMQLDDKLSASLCQPWNHGKIQQTKWKRPVGRLSALQHMFATTCWLLINLKVTKSRNNYKSSALIRPQLNPITS